MEELKEFLLSHTYVKTIYFIDEVWSIHKPNGEHKVKTREELLSFSKVEQECETKEKLTKKVK
jgi:hypothetical protein